MPSELQELCERGSEELIAMQYLDAEATLARAETIAWAARDFDTLARLYMPLQEARRQKRQRCGEGIVRLDLIASSDADQPDAAAIAGQYPNAQLLVAGWGTVGPALELREIQREQQQYAETFLAAAYPYTGGKRAVMIVPTDDVALPAARERSIDELLAQAPPQCIVMHEDELPKGPRQGTSTTYGVVMNLWERLHLPFLAAADMQADPIQKIEHYRRAIRVDYACELAHQKLSDVAKELGQKRRGA